MSILKPKKFIRKVLLRSIPRKIKDLVIVDNYQNASDHFTNQIQKYRTKCYSQHGEDLVLKRFFLPKQDGFYVDVGAHHPLRFSNTHLFYEIGWRGINVDAMPESMALFDELRPLDVNIERLVGELGKHTFYIFEQTPCNTMDEVLATQRLQNGLSLKDKVYLDSQPLASILNEYISSGQHIDFMSIYVEGAELDVLRSNDWIRFRPTIILLEELDMHPIRNTLSRSLNTYMEGVGYQLYYKCFHTLIYVEKNHG